MLALLQTTASGRFFGAKFSIKQYRFDSMRGHTDPELISSLNEAMKICTLEKDQNIHQLVCAAGECRFCDLTKADCKNRVDRDLNTETTNLLKEQ